MRRSLIGGVRSTRNGVRREWDSVMGGIFINYRTSDSALGAVMLDNKLTARFGNDAVFRDNRSIPLATAFEPLLWKRLRRSDLIIVVIGPHWLSESSGAGRLIDDPNDFVHREIAEALRLEIDVLPVLIGDPPRLQPSDLPVDLHALCGQQFFTIRSRDPEPDMDRLVELLAKRPDLLTVPNPATSTGETSPAGAPNGIKVGKVKAGRDVIFGNRGGDS